MNFQGFPVAALDFYEDLEMDNTRSFWDANKHIYQEAVRQPLLALLDAVAEEFGEGKVFRPHRDVRFSHDKSPYKLAGAAAIGDNSASSAIYYVQISAEGLFVASGIYMMTRDQLQRFYAAVDDETAGETLVDVVAQTRSAGLDVGGSELTTAPRGYPRDHPRIELLRHKSVTVSRTFGPDHQWLSTPRALEEVVGVWRSAGPVNNWLAQHVGHPDERQVRAHRTPEA